MQERFLQLLNKTLRDEISASIFYKKAALEIIGKSSKGVAEELATHGDEEYGHFKLLLEYASKFEIFNELQVTLDMEVINFPITTTEDVIAKIQSLEVQAISDYKELYALSKQFGDFTGMELFSDLVEDEEEHFDDLAFVLNQKRQLFPSDVSPIESDGEMQESTVIKKTVYAAILKK